MTRVFDLALNSMWAMEESSLRTLLAVAERQNEVSFETLEAYRAKSLDKSARARVRDGVALIDVAGPMFKRANMFASISGASSYETLRLDLQAAMDDPKIKALVMTINSPGGEVTGVSELSQALFDMRGRKPIVAYVEGMGASAAYWLASAADKVIVADTAMIGSIGVMASLTDTTAADEKKGIKAYTFISSQSPDKNAGPDTPEGAKALQAHVDALATVFVANVARNRGVDVQTVLKDFGKGGTFIGKDAVTAGMADAVGNFESVLADLSGAHKAASRSTRSGRTTMSNNAGDPAAETPPVDVAAEVAKAVALDRATERNRVSGLTRIATAHGIEAGVLQAAIDDDSTIEAFAIRVADLAATKTAAAGTAAVTALKADEAATAALAASTGAEAGEVTAESLAKEILASAALAAGEA